MQDYEIRKIADAAVQLLNREAPDIKDRLTAMTAIVVDIIGSLPLKMGGDEVALGILCEIAGDVLAKKRLAGADHAGEA